MPRKPRGGVKNPRVHQSTLIRFFFYDEVKKTKTRVAFLFPFSNSPLFMPELNYSIVTNTMPFRYLQRFLFFVILQDTSSNPSLECEIGGLLSTTSRCTLQHHHHHPTTDFTKKGVVFFSASVTLLLSFFPSLPSPCMQDDSTTPPRSPEGIPERAPTLEEVAANLLTEPVSIPRMSPAPPKMLGNGQTALELIEELVRREVHRRAVDGDVEITRQIVYEKGTPLAPQVHALETMIGSLEAEIAALTNANAALTAENREKSKRITDLDDQRRGAEALHAKALQEIERLRKELAESERLRAQERADGLKELPILREQLAAKDKEIASWKLKYEELEEKNRKLALEVDILQRDLASARDDVEHANKRAAASEREKDEAIRRMQSELDSKSAESAKKLRAMQDENDSLVRKLKDAAEEVDAARNKLALKTSEIEDLMKRLSAKEEEIDRLKSQNRSTTLEMEALDKKLRHANGDLEMLQKQLREKDSELARMTQKYKDEEEARELLAKTLRQHETDLDSANRKAKQLEEDVARLERRLRDAEEENDRIRKQMRDVKPEPRNTDDLDELKRELETLRHKLKLETQRAGDEEVRATKLQRQLDDVTKTLQGRIRELESELANAGRTGDDADAMRRKESEITDLKLKITDLEREIAALKAGATPPPTIVRREETTPVAPPVAPPSVVAVGSDLYALELARLEAEKDALIRDLSEVRAKYEETISLMRATHVHDVEVMKRTLDSTVAGAPLVHRFVRPGSRVKRNEAHWKWGDQDGGIGNHGTVKVVDLSLGWVCVKWDKTAVKDNYRWNNEEAWDVVLVEGGAEARVLELELTVEAGLTMPSPLPLHGVMPLGMGDAERLEYERQQKELHEQLIATETRLKAVESRGAHTEMELLDRQRSVEEVRLALPELEKQLAAAQAVAARANTREASLERLLDARCAELRASTEHAAAMETRLREAEIREETLSRRLDGSLSELRRQQQRPGGAYTVRSDDPLALVSSPSVRFTKQRLRRLLPEEDGPGKRVSPTRQRPVSIGGVSSPPPMNNTSPVRSHSPRTNLRSPHGHPWP